MSCEQNYIPKPRAYFRIALPETHYKTVRTPHMSFELLTSSTISSTKKDSSWITIHYPDLKAALYLSYFDKADIEALSEDARKSAYKHAIKADDIYNLPFAFPEKRVYGTVYGIEGNAASPVILQFNDSIGQFVHGSLYFNCAPNADSLKPVIHFVRQDVQHIIETFEWSHQ